MSLGQGGGMVTGSKRGEVMSLGQGGGEIMSLCQDVRVDRQLTVSGGRPVYIDR